MSVQVTITGRRVVAGVAILVVLTLAGYGIFDLVRPERSLGDAIDPARFQAVALSSGAVYFGHLRAAGDDFYELRDAFFIQETKAAGRDPSRRVVPLSRELHGPENRMMIPREHVVSIENLRSDSPVTQAAQTRGQ